mmetsp:Transcript_108170/g.170540  ORF Transcript_108170/g.170540 Transcript_108170/m.170540 type:complete len:207 (-) Transcript_108170:40-660(-)
MNFQTDVPQATLDSWMSTPYAQAIERTVRAQVHAEYQQQREHDLASLMQHLQDQAALRQAAEERVDELSKQLLVVPELHQKIADLKWRLLACADKGAGAGLLANAHALCKDAFIAWHTCSLQSKLEESYRTRPRPCMAECHAEINAIKQLGEQRLRDLHSGLHDQITQVTRRYLDLEKYQDGKPPPRPGEQGADFQPLIEQSVTLS